MRRRRLGTIGKWESKDKKTRENHNIMLGFSCYCIGATLAQLVERHFCKVDVPSSNLGGGSSVEDNLICIIHEILH